MPNLAALLSPVATPETMVDPKLLLMLATGTLLLLNGLIASSFWTRESKEPSEDEANVTERS